MLSDSLIDLGSAAGEGSDQIAHGVELGQLHQPGDGVQLVGELVRLGPQRVGDAAV